MARASRRGNAKKRLAYGNRAFVRAAENFRRAVRSSRSNRLAFANNGLEASDMHVVEYLRGSRLRAPRFKPAAPPTFACLGAAENAI